MVSDVSITGISFAGVAVEGLLDTKELVSIMAHLSITDMSIHAVTVVMYQPTKGTITMILIAI